MHQTHGAGGARPSLQRHIGTQGNHGRMRIAQRQMQKAQRIEHRLQLGGKTPLQLAARQFGCRSTGGMTAHAVNHRQQRSLFVDRHKTAVLIVFARADQAHLGNINAQN